MSHPHAELASALAATLSADNAARRGAEARLQAARESVA